MANFLELDIDQGADFSLSMDLTNDDGTPKDVSYFTYSSSIKKSYYSQLTLADFSVNYAEAANGIIVLELSADTTADIPAGRYLFDVKQVDDNNSVSRLAEGVVTVNPRITE